ncbi:MAG: hypothetical protein NTX61_06205 [Bacteroidetes bacterium]|nr:hypothetical protein [Bacteroidota bacterium]
MKITELLLNKWDLLTGYFTGKTFDDWKRKYDKKPNEFHHDEPWVTLVATYAIFGTQRAMKQGNRIDAFNSLLKSSKLSNTPVMKSIAEIKIEKHLPEIRSFRELMKSCAFHYFPDVKKTIENKQSKKNASFEGNSHIDLFIRGTSLEGKNICFYIEAKFNSDISHGIRYNPVRNQIIRIIDSAIEFQQKSAEELDKERVIDDFYFLLLTPKIYRTQLYGGNRKTSIEIFQPQKSRLYCYKMDEYKNFRNIMMALPHRVEITESKWKHISGNIGWLTFEDMIKTAQNYNTMDPRAKTMIEEFMNERNFIE